MHRVLVIDDNPDDLALAEVILSRAGFEVWLLDEPLRAVDIAVAYGRRSGHVFRRGSS